MKLLLDTATLLWLDEEDIHLGKETRRLIENAVRKNALFISSISLWEIGRLAGMGRLRLKKAVEDWWMDWVHAGIKEITLDHKAIFQSIRIIRFHKDNADCLIMGTALTHYMTLVTSDEKILAWNGPLERHDARV